MRTEIFALIFSTVFLVAAAGRAQSDNVVASKHGQAVPPPWARYEGTRDNFAEVEALVRSAWDLGGTQRLETLVYQLSHKFGALPPEVYEGLFRLYFEFGQTPMQRVFRDSVEILLIRHAEFGFLPEFAIQRILEHTKTGELALVILRDSKKTIEREPSKSLLRGAFDRILGRAGSVTEIHADFLFLVGIEEIQPDTSQLNRLRQMVDVNDRADYIHLLRSYPQLLPLISSGFPLPPFSEVRNEWRQMRLQQHTHALSHRARSQSDVRKRYEELVEMELAMTIVDSSGHNIEKFAGSLRDMDEAQVVRFREALFLMRQTRHSKYESFYLTLMSSPDLPLALRLPLLYAAVSFQSQNQAYRQAIVDLSLKIGAVPADLRILLGPIRQSTIRLAFSSCEMIFASP